jgi:hypothetical protein
MKQITLRGLSPKLGKIIKEEAEKRHLSLNKSILALLEGKVAGKEPAPKETVYHDLDTLCGVWSKREANEFERYLAKQRRIDKEMWK